MRCGGGISEIRLSGGMGHMGLRRTRMGSMGLTRRASYWYKLYNGNRDCAEDGRADDEHGERERS